jgi:hypothetical protein
MLQGVQGMLHKKTGNLALEFRGTSIYLQRMLCKRTGEAGARSAEGMKLFIEDRAFSASYDLAPPPPSVSLLCPFKYREESALHRDVKYIERR